MRGHFIFLLTIWMMFLKCDASGTNNKDSSITRPRPMERQHRQKRQSPSRCGNEDDQVYTFAIGENYGPYEYKDLDGYAKGFNIDLIQASEYGSYYLKPVCQNAHKECYHVMDRYNRCWETDADGGEYPGEGLLGGWYDGCVGLLPSPGRLNAFNFRASKAGVFFNKGTSFNMTGDNYIDLSGWKIGFITGWAVNQHCLARQRFSGNQHGDYEAVMYDSNEDMMTSLLLKKIDAIVTSEIIKDKADVMGLEEVGPLFQCTTAGSSMMARYGDPVIHWWNEAFQNMVQNGEYQQLCQQAQEEHGFRGTVDCLDPTEARLVVAHPYQEAGNSTRRNIASRGDCRAALHSGITVAIALFLTYVELV